jgi:diguanylate cyclase (GGDEF)-like protein
MTEPTTHQDAQLTSDSHILIVEDSATQLEMLKFLLEENGYSVSTANNGLKGIEAARNQRPDLIISDVVMPIMGGYEMCRTLKTDANLHSIPIMLLTTLASAEDVILGLNCYADYYTTKPYEDDYLLTRVQAVLKLPKEQDSGDNENDGMEVIVANKSYTVRAGRRQMLNLLLSTYENAVQRNAELLKTQNELKLLNRQLREQHARLEEANTQLESLATVDGLTGLKNHRAFQERLYEEFLRAMRHQIPLSLLMCDVDHFKQFNDTFGHPAGDEVLRSVSAIMGQQARATDVVARYGGEEFVLILPDTSAAGSAELAERLRYAIEAAPWTKRAITISIGGASITPLITNPAKLIAHADKALYRSKHNGRNCFTHATDLPRN